MQESLLQAEKMKHEHVKERNSTDVHFGVFEEKTQGYSGHFSRVPRRMQE